MKRILAVIVLALSACAPAHDPSAPPGDTLLIKEYQVKLHDGSEVTCLAYKDGYGGGLSCDWGDR